MVVQAKATGMKELRANLAAAAERGVKPQPVLREVADDFRQAERAYLGRVRWTPLSLQYAARKARNGHSTRPGVLTGRLLNSLTSESDRYHYERVTDEGLEVGTKNPVARLFDKGTSRQPKRKLIRLSPRDRRGMLTTITDYLLDPLR
jgi:phage gpG-like protein